MKNSEPIFPHTSMDAPNYTSLTYLWHLTEGSEYSVYLYQLSILHYSTSQKIKSLKAEVCWFTIWAQHTVETDYLCNTGWNNSRFSGLRDLNSVLHWTKSGGDEFYYLFGGQKQRMSFLIKPSYTIQASSELIFLFHSQSMLFHISLSAPFCFG